MEKSKWILKCVLGGIVFLLLAALVTMGLWNWLVPTLFRGPEIQFLETLGLLLLTRILFGQWGGGRCGGGGHSWKQRYQQKLATMTPEERERFKSRMREKWRCDPGDQQRNAGSAID